MTATSSPADRRLRDMIRHQHVDMLEFRYDGLGLTFEKARRTCARCDSIEACARWLMSDRSGPAPEFCPNRRLFKRFQIM